MRLNLLMIALLVLTAHICVAFHINSPSRKISSQQSILMLQEKDETTNQRYVVSNTKKMPMIATFASISLLLSLSLPMSPDVAHASETGLLTTTLRAPTSATPSSKSVKDVLREYMGGSGSSRTISSPETPASVTESAPSPAVASSPLKLPEIPSVTLPQLDVPPVALPPITLPSSLRELWTDFLSDWRIPVSIAAGIIMIDAIMSSNENFANLSEKEVKIKLLTKSLEELEDLNVVNNRKIEEMKIVSEGLAGQVASLSAELKQKFVAVNSMNTTVTGVKSATTKLDSQIQTELYETIQTLAKTKAENEELKQFKVSAAESEEATAVMKAREDEIVSALKSFLLNQGYVSQGVANMVIAGTIASVVKECDAKSTGKVDVKVEVNAPVVVVEPPKEVPKQELPIALPVFSAREKEELERKLDNSRGLIAKLHDQLADANLVRVQAAKDAQKTGLLRAKAGALETEVERLKTQLRAVVSAPVVVAKPVPVVQPPPPPPVVAAVPAVQEENKEAKALAAKLSEALESEKRLKAQIQANEEQIAALNAKLASIPVPAPPVPVAAPVASAVAGEGVVGVSSDMEAYLGHLKEENEELKSRLLTSDEQLMELTTSMQRKVDSAKDMAKMLNAQLLQKTSDFEKRERQVLEQLAEAKIKAAKAAADALAAASAAASSSTAAAEGKPAKKTPKTKAKKEVAKTETETAAPGMKVQEEGTLAAPASASGAEVTKKTKQSTKSAPTTAAAAVTEDGAASSVDLSSWKTEDMKPYMLRKKSKKEIGDIVTAMKLKDKSGALIDASSTSKNDMLALLEEVLFSS